jgi:hypothetical protein
MPPVEAAEGREVEQPLSAVGCFMGEMLHGHFLAVLCFVCASITQGVDSRPSQHLRVIHTHTHNYSCSDSAHMPSATKGLA